MQSWGSFYAQARQNGLNPLDAKAQADRLYGMQNLRRNDQPSALRRAFG